MAYGLKYELLCKSKAANDYKLKLLFDGYTDPEVNRNMPFDQPLVLRKDKAAVIRGTSLYFGIREEVDFELDEFYTNNPKKIKGELYKDTTLLWTGYVLPQQYQADYVPVPLTVRFTATDQLALLKSETFALTGLKSQLEILIYCIDKIGLELGYSIAVNLFEADHDEDLSPLAQTFENAVIYSGNNCYDVIEKILRKYDAEITQLNGRWYITCSADKESTRMLYTTAGVYEDTEAAPTVLDLGYPDASGIEVYPVGRLTRTLEPGAKKVTLTHDFGRKKSLLDNYDFNEISSGQFTSWTQTGSFTLSRRILDGKPYAFLSGGDDDTSHQISQQIAVVDTGTDDFVFEVNFAPHGKSSTASAITTISMTVRIAVALNVSGTVHYLSKEGWTTTPTIIEEIVRASITSPVWNTLRIITEGLPGDGDLTVALYRYSNTEAVRPGDTFSGVAFSEPLVYFVRDNQLYASGLETLATFDNSTEPDDLGTIDISAADAPDYDNKGLLYYNITKASDGTPTELWHRLGDATEYTFLVQLARAIASNNRVAKQVLRGMIKGADLNFGSIIKHTYNSDRKFEISEGEWDLYQERWTVVLTEVLTWSSESITFSSSSANVSSSSSGSLVTGAIIGAGVGNDAGITYEPLSLLDSLLAVDGAGSGLDADLLDGQHGAYYAPIASPTFTGVVTMPASVVIPDGGTIGQAAGPLLTFNDTNNTLGISGGKLHITPIDDTDIQILNMYRADGTTLGGRFVYSTTSDMRLYLYDGSENLDVYLNTNGASYFRGGEVGIGTNAPTRLLHIHNAGTGTTDVSYTHYTTGDTGALVTDGFDVGYAASDYAILINRENTKMSFGTNNTERLIIAPAGALYEPSFTSGFQGSNWRIDTTGDAEFNNVLIRGGLSVYELIINQLHYQNGGLIIGAGAGKVATIETATAGSEVLTFHDPEGDSVVPFTAGAIVMTQRVDINRTDVVKKIVRQVASVSGMEITFTTTTGWTTGDDVGAFEIGDELCAIGHTSNAALDSSIYFSATDSDNPFMRVFDGVSSYAKWSLSDKTTIKLQLGNLASLASYDILPASPGYGLYCSNVYLTGKMVLPTAGMTDEGSAAGSIRMYAGDTYNNRTTAPFRVTQAGAVTATSGVIGGFTLTSTALTGSSAGTAGWCTINSSTGVFGITSQQFYAYTQQSTPVTLSAPIYRYVTLANASESTLNLPGSGLPGSGTGTMITIIHAKGTELGTGKYHINGNGYYINIDGSQVSTFDLDEGEAITLYWDPRYGGQWYNC